MKCKLFLCAKSISIDHADNNVSVFGILEDVQAVGFPILFGPFKVLAMLDKEHGDKEKPDVEMRIFLNQKLLVTHPANVDFQGKPRCRATVSVQGIIVPMAGTLKVGFYHKNKAMSEWRMEVQPMPSSAKVDLLPSAMPMPYGAPLESKKSKSKAKQMKKPAKKK